jgi:hypothetical protein
MGEGLSGGNGATPQPQPQPQPAVVKPDALLQLVLVGDQLQFNESAGGDDLLKLKMLATATQVIVARMLEGKTAGGIILPSGRPDLRLG